MKKKNNEIDKKLTDIFSNIFDKSKKKFKNFSESSESEWDSLKGVNLLLEIEKVFKIRISPNDLEKFNSFKNIKTILEKINENQK